MESAARGPLRIDSLERLVGAATALPTSPSTPRRARMGERNGTVVCPGSYDPVTNGHLDIITRTSRVFIGSSSASSTTRSARRKRCSPPRSGGSSSARRRPTSPTSRCRSSPTSWWSSLAKRAPRRSSRGCGRSPTSSTSSRWRSSTASSTRYRERVHDRLTQYSFLSSTGVKEMETFGGDVSGLVPTPVVAAMADRLGER